MNLFSAFATDVGIDLGTANTCIFARGRGIVLNEPSIVAFNTARGCVEAVGTEAHEMLGRAPANIKPVRPMKDGVIADFEAAEKMLTHFVRKAQGARTLRRPRLVIGVPPEITQVERRAVKESGFRVKASEVHLVDEPMAAAIGCGLPVTEAAGNMIIDIGGGTTDIAVISLAGTVYGRSLRVAGNALDEAILLYMRKAHNLLIGERTAEHIKLEVGSAAALEVPLIMEVKGRHLLEGVPRTVLINDGEIREAIADPVRQIVAAVRDALECIPPELSADIYDRGVVLTGGGALLRNLDQRLREETGLPVMVAENPLTSVVVGVGRMLTDLALLRRVMTD
ncbi:MAG: rod shape-determining protein [Vicinamibacterales bacterium]